jgi:hypothetical protein
MVWLGMHPGVLRAACGISGNYARDSHAASDCLLNGSAADSP